MMKKTVAKARSRRSYEQKGAAVAAITQFEYGGLPQAFEFPPALLEAVGKGLSQ